MRDFDGSSAVKLCVWEPCTRAARRKFCNGPTCAALVAGSIPALRLVPRVPQCTPRAGRSVRSCYQRKRLVDASEAAELAALKATNPARCPRCPHRLRGRL